MTPHGSSSTYTKHRCRCEECKAAWNRYVRLRREERRLAMEAGELTPEHGRVSTYTNFRCRCEECKAASRAYYRLLRSS